MPVFSVLHVRPDGSKIRTTIRVELNIGCFMGDMKITAFDGEVEIHVHTSCCHLNHWVVLIKHVDDKIQVIEGEWKRGGDVIEESFDAITKAETKDGHGDWWTKALPQIREHLNLPAPG